MQELIDALISRLKEDPNRANAQKIVLALAAETRKRLASVEPEQREFDAKDLADAAEPGVQWDFDRAKRWVTNANVDRYLAARRSSLEEYFRNEGLRQCLRVEKLPTSGKHRARWRLIAYELGDVASESSAVGDADATGKQGDGCVPEAQSVDYDLSPPGAVRPSWWAWPLLRSGSFPTRSAQGALWAGFVFLAIVEILVCAFVLWSFTLQRRPVQASDLAEILGLLALIWVVWTRQARPLFNLVEDRIIPVGDAWVALREAPAQLELAKVNGRRVVRLVRYNAVCTVCAGQVGLRYSQGQNRRRLVGCCEEAPHEHVFTFDRVLLKGRHIQDGGASI